jgi:hypothetical protein
MIELTNDSLNFSFPEVHAEAECRIEFQRTLRIPDDNREYPLPPGLGGFPLEHVEDHAQRISKTIVERGGVMLPMYQSEAMWISFSSYGYPFAIKIAAGKVNAVTGEGWSNELSRTEQDYIVIPDQPWLDGFCVQKGKIRQFVAMPLGGGYTAEEQIINSAEYGGVQIIAYPMKAAHYEKLMEGRRGRRCFSLALECCLPAPMDMGLAPGGLMRQEVYEDVYGIDAWDMTRSSRCFVHILNSKQWEGVTGKYPPTIPPSAKDYTAAGLPWFEYYADNLSALTGSAKLAGMDSVAAKGVKIGEQPLPENEMAHPAHVVALGHSQHKISDGNW